MNYSTADILGADTMSYEDVQTASQEPMNSVAIDALPDKKTKKPANEKVMEFLREIQEAVGQIAESEIEEGNLVHEFFSAVLKTLGPFSKTLEISIDSLPEIYTDLVDKAVLYCTGQLVLVYKDGRVEILSLKDKENRRLLVDIAGDIMSGMKLKIDSYRSETEKRVRFLMLMTKELQKVAKVLSEESPRHASSIQ